MAELDVNRAKSNDLRLFEQEVEQRLQLHDEPDRVSFNLVESEPSTSQSGHATDDHEKPEPKEPEKAQSTKNPNLDGRSEVKHKKAGSCSSITVEVTSTNAGCGSATTSSGEGAIAGEEWGLVGREFWVVLGLDWGLRMVCGGAKIDQTVVVVLVGLSSSEGGGTFWRLHYEKFWNISYVQCADMDVTRAENNYLRLFEQEVEWQLQLQDG
ncbi:hypothetical protein WN943_003196 [Citrus x changshan-huyou]